MSNEYKYIHFRKSDGVGEIILNNPPVNIMTQAMMQEINSVLEGLAENCSIQILIFKSEGKHFSAGADVGEHVKEKCGEMIPEFTKLFKNLNKIPCPTIAVVQGLALGGGCELVMFCDMVVASEKAKLGQPEIAVGVYPPVAAALLPRLVGRNRALELLLSGDVVTATEAERIGLINKVFLENEFASKTDEFIAKFRSKSRVVMNLTKKAIDGGLYMPVEQAMDLAENIYLSELMNSEDANEGLAAFLEKRNPVWTGK